MTPKIKEIYEKMREQFFTVVDEKVVSAHVRQSQLQKLQQISNGFIIKNNPRDDVEDEILVIDHYPPKLQKLEQLVDSNPGEKFIVWAWYRADFDWLRDRFDNPAEVHGGVSGSTQESHIQRFKHSDNCRVMLAHPASAKYSETWVVANNTVYYSWSHSVLEYTQSRDRNYRLGQEDPTTEYFLIGSPIDREIYEAVKENKDFSETFADNEKFRRVLERAEAA